MRHLRRPHPPRAHHGHPPPHRHSGDHLLEALDLLVRFGQVRTVTDLAAAAASQGHTEAATYLCALSASPLPLGLVLRKLEVKLEEDAFERQQEMLAAAAGKSTGLIMPLPPHVLDLFLSSERQTSVLLVDGEHGLPPHLRDEELEVVHGRQCRRRASEFGVLIFEVARQVNDLVTAPEAADIVDSNLIDSATRMYGHVRPHAHVGDIVLSAAASKRLVLL